MTTGQTRIEATHSLLDGLARLAREAFNRAAIDCSAPSAPLKSAVLGLIGWMVAEASCVAAALTSAAPQGVAPNVRSMLEALVTALYLTDQTVTPEQRDERLDRFFRGVRRAQVKLREGLDVYPRLKNVLLVDRALADREKTELQALEAALPSSKQLGKKHWSGTPEGLKTMAETVGLGSDYVVQFRAYSGSVHGERPWDHARINASGMLVLPSLSANRDQACFLASDALRYLAWCISIGFKYGALTLYRSEQEELDKYRKYIQPLDSLYANGIVGLQAES